MNREEIGLVAQLLTSMKEAVKKLENAKEKKDMEDLLSAKKEILKFKKELEKVL
jgi:hypothetical protein